MSRTRMFTAVFLASLALSAVAAGSAQAGWLVLGSLLVGSTAVASATKEDKNDRIRYSEIEIECTALTIVGGEISEPARVLARSLEDTGCEVSQPTTCKLSSSTIGTLPVEGSVTLDGALAVRGRTEAENSDELLATFKLNGSACSVTGVQALIGTWAVLAPEGQDQRLSEKFRAFIEKDGELQIGSAAVQILLRTVNSGCLW